MSTVSALYSPTEQAFLQIDQDFYQSINQSILEQAPVKRVTIAPRSGEAWQVKAGQVFRVVAVDGPQVVDFNCWHLHNPRERFWASRTRQLFGAHIGLYDQLWSNLPYLRPLATIIDDSISYGIDADGAGCHDLLGTRCDPYIHQKLTGETLNVCCHSNLTRAVMPYQLDERDVHDVLNIFQVTGLTAKEEKYFVKPCPAQAGDHLTFFAEQDLLCAASACPHGDMSQPIWGEQAQDTADICRRIEIEIYTPDKALLTEWQSPTTAAYDGNHGLRFQPK